MYPYKNKKINNFYLPDPIFTTIKIKLGIFGFFKYFIYHQNEYKNSLIHTVSFTDIPYTGGAGWGGETKEGWPLLIQRLGICIWLLFVNQWSDRADQGVSPRLSLSLRTHAQNTFTKKTTQLYAEKPNVCSHMKPLQFGLINTWAICPRPSCGVFFSLCV